MKLIELDVADSASVRAGFETILSAAGQVDVLVNSAGIAGNGVVEEIPIEVYEQVMNVNFHGVLRCIKAVLPSMRHRRSGTIINISSVVGRIAAIAQAPYVASKWALEGMSEELAQELAIFNIRVAIIEPGVTRSAIFAKNTDSTSPGSDYEPHLRRMFRFYAAGRAAATDPFEVAEVVAHAATTHEPRLRYQVSWGGRELVEGRRRITDEEWVALGALEDDGDYYRVFTETFDLDIASA